MTGQDETKGPEELHELDEFVKKGLSGYIIQQDHQKHVVDLLVAEGVGRVQARVMVTMLAPLLKRGIDATSGKVTAKLKKETKNLLLKIPYIKEAGEKLFSLNADFEKKVEEARNLRSFFEGSSGAPTDEEKKKLSTEKLALVRIYEEQQKLAAQFKPQLNLSLNLYKESEQGTNRFLYGVRKALFQERVEEFGALVRFIDDDAKFRWQLVAGGGGFGKSRLALEFCLTLGDEWEAGFIDLKSKDAAFFNSWSPDRPAFIVVDYVAGQEENLRDIVKLLRDRADGFDHPVRFLLLERDHEGVWYDRFIGTENREKIESTRFGDPLLLPPLNEEQLLELIVTFAGAEIKVNRQEALARLQEIDADQRALFASMLGDDIRNGGQADDKESLVRDFIARDKENFWGVPTDEELDALAFCTMVGGLDHSRDNLPAEVNAIIDPINWQRYARIVGKPANEIFHPLEPDIIGELFVLDHFAPRSRGDDRLQLFKRLAWEIDNGWGFAKFLSRAVRDFPHHKSVELLSSWSSYLDEDRCLIWTSLAVNLVLHFYLSGNHELALQSYSEQQNISSKYGTSKILEKQAMSLVTILAFSAPKPNIDSYSSYKNELRSLHEKYSSTVITECYAQGTFNALNAHLEVGDSSEAIKSYQELEELIKSDKAEIAFELLGSGTYNLMNFFRKKENFGDAEDYYHKLQTLANQHKKLILYKQQARGAVNLILSYESKTDLASIGRLCDDLLQLFLSHKEPSFLKSLSKGMVSLISAHLRKENGALAEQIYSHMQELRSHHMELIREQLAMGAINITHFYGNESSNHFEMGKRNYYLREFLDLIQHADNFDEIKFKQYCLRIRSELNTNPNTPSPDTPSPS